MRRTSRLAPLVLGAFTTLAGCRQAGEAPGEQGVEEGGPFYVVTRCGFRLGAAWHHIGQESPFLIGLKRPREAEEIRTLTREFLRLLAPGGAPPVASETQADRGRAVRTYEMSDMTAGKARGAGPELEVLDEGSGTELTVVARRGGGEVRLRRQLPELSFVLRQVALTALKNDMALEPYPGRQPLPWHGAALARFLAPGVLVYPPDWREAPAAQERRIVQSILTELRRLDDPAGVAALAGALVPALGVLSDADVDALRADGRPATRVLLLTREAQAGKREALAEILALSQEHGGDVALFAAAVRSLLPARQNPLLWQKYPSGSREGDLRLLDDVGKRLAALTFAPGAGWKLEESPAVAPPGGR